jgi:hypothetical protein
MSGSLFNLLLGFNLPAYFKICHLEEPLTLSKLTPNKFSQGVLANTKLVIDILYRPKPESVVLESFIKPPAWFG